MQGIADPLMDSYAGGFQFSRSKRQSNEDTVFLFVLIISTKRLAI